MFCSGSAPCTGIPKPMASQTGLQASPTAGQQTVGPTGIASAHVYPRRAPSTHSPDCCQPQVSKRNAPRLFVLRLPTRLRVGRPGAQSPQRSFKVDDHGAPQPFAFTTHAKPREFVSHTSSCWSCCRGISEAPSRRKFDEQTLYTARPACGERRPCQL